MLPYPNMNYYAQPAMQMPYVSKFVSDFNQINVADVPMDGKWVLFGKNDMSEVCAKAWTGNGTIQTLEYSLKQTVLPSSPNTFTQGQENGLYEPISAQIKALQESVDNMNDKIDRLNKNRGGKNEPNANS